MATGQNDVNILKVQTNDNDFPANSPIQVRVTAEVGTALHATGGKYRVRMALTDITNPGLLDSQQVVGNYGDAAWPAPGENTFTFNVPAAATAGKAGDILEPQASLIGNAAAPFDGSHVVGETLLVTP